MLAILIREVRGRRERPAIGMGRTLFVFVSREEGEGGEEMG